MDKRALKYVMDRFGIPESVFDGLDFAEQSGVWIGSHRTIHLSLRHPVRRGIRFARTLSRGVKLTTAALQIFGRHATRNLIHVDLAVADLYIRGQDIKVGEREGVENGQVIVVHHGHVLGSGLYRDGRVKNQIPKARRIVN
jgi:NOL1/NOP2/fmu family ribosome biogenesis protein